MSASTPQGANGTGQPDGQMDVSVLVAVRNEEGFVRQTVAAMQAQRFHGRIEFLFVEGRSDDRTREILEQLAETDHRIRILDNPARQLASALNVGLRNARGEFVVQMDAHTYYPPDYVEKGVERLRRGDVTWVTGPPIPYGVNDWSRRVALALGSWLGTGGSNKWPSRLDAVAARNGAVDEIELDTSVFAGIWRRTTLEELGGWDEGWPVNHDSELAARVLERGGRIVCLRELGSRYVPRGSLSGLARQYFRYGFYRGKTSARHPASMRRSHLLAPAVTVAVGASLAGPRPLRKLSRAGAGVYAGAVLAASAGASRGGEPGDRWALPAVFATMHLAWGLGFLAACARFGPPFAAIARALRRHS
jgi:glycosyltransferase involved in cell wall biosynthesis